MGSRFQPGDVFAGFQIVELIDAGGMGEVYRAHDRDGLPRLVALKLLHSGVSHDAAARNCFLREADLVAKLDHPNIVTIFARGEESGLFWIAMRHVDGTDVAKVIRRDHRIAPDRAVRIITETAAALDFAHDAKVLHRDVKPANILLTNTNPERAMLTDFGIAKEFGGSGTPTASANLVASFHYVAPERLLLTGNVDHRADVYSLGCTLYYMLAGEHPYPGADMRQLMYAHLHEPIPAPSARNPALPRAFDSLIATALAKDPDARPATCGVLAQGAAEALEVELPNRDRSVKPSPAQQVRRLEPSAGNQRRVPKATRRAAKLAEQFRLNLRQINGSGTDGYIVPQDVYDALRRRSNPIRPKIPPVGEKAVNNATPRAEWLASVFGINLVEVFGTGPDGEIVAQDVYDADRQRRKEFASAAPPEPERSRTPTDRPRLEEGDPPNSPGGELSQVAGSGTGTGVLLPSEPEPYRAPIEKKPTAPLDLSALPSAKEDAARLNVDISKVKGTGPGGLIMNRDVVAYYRETRRVPATLQVNSRFLLRVVAQVAAGALSGVFAVTWIAYGVLDRSRGAGWGDVIFGIVALLASYLAFKGVMKTKRRYDRTYKRDTSR